MSADHLSLVEQQPDVEAIRAEYDSPLAAYLLTLIANYVDNPQAELSRLREVSRPYEAPYIAWNWVGLDARAPFIHPRSPVHKGTLGYAIGICTTADEAVNWYVDLAKKFHKDIKSPFNWGYAGRVMETIRLQHVRPEILLDLDRWLGQHLYLIKRDNHHQAAAKFRHNTYMRLHRLYTEAQIDNRPSLMYKFNVDSAKGVVRLNEQFFYPTVEPTEYAQNIPFDMDANRDLTRILENFSLLCLHLAHPMSRAIIQEHKKLLLSFCNSKSKPMGLKSMLGGGATEEKGGIVLPALTVALPDEIADFNAM